MPEETERDQQRDAYAADLAAIWAGVEAEMTPGEIGLPKPPVVSEANLPKAPGFYGIHPERAAELVALELPEAVRACRSRSELRYWWRIRVGVWTPEAEGFNDARANPAQLDAALAAHLAAAPPPKIKRRVIRRRYALPKRQPAALAALLALAEPPAPAARPVEAALPELPAPPAGAAAVARAEPVPAEAAPPPARAKRPQPASEATPGEGEAMPAKRGRGRPPKVKAEPQAAPRKRGRPPKVKA